MKKQTPHFKFTATIALLNGLRIEDKSGSFGKADAPECWMIQNLEGGQVRLSFQAKDGLDADRIVHTLMQRHARTRKRTLTGRNAQKVGPQDYRLVALSSNYTGQYDVPKGANPSMQPKRKAKDQTIEMTFA